MRLLDQVQNEVLRRLEGVSVAARHAVESALSGLHRGIYRGLSVEFAGHRPYQPGDDLRSLDWQVFARTDRYAIRTYEEETRLRATLVLDASGSMAYGGMGGSKFDYARTLAAALAFLMVRQGDAVALAVVDNGLRQQVEPAATMGHLLRLFTTMEGIRPGGATALGPVLEDLADRLHRRGLVIVFSDCFDDPAGIGRALCHLRHRRQEVRVFQVLDPDESGFPFSGPWEFLGLEGEPTLGLDADRIRPHYLRALAAHRRTLAAACHEQGVDLTTVRLDEDPALVLLQSLQ